MGNEWPPKANRSTPFPLMGTLNWMRALSLLIDDMGFADAEICTFYSKVQRHPVNKDIDYPGAFRSLLMAQHHSTALGALVANENPYHVARLAVISWYYTVYESASAMTAAQSGHSSQNHSGTAKIWRNEIATRGLALQPFDTHLTSIKESDVKAATKLLRDGNNHQTHTKPWTAEQAWGVHCGYLSGTADDRRDDVDEELKKTTEYKELGVTNFLTRPAQELRNTRHSNTQVGFLVQAFRYRGKANYRDSIYLSYGKPENDKIYQLLQDLDHVAKAFMNMAHVFVSKKVPTAKWDSYVEGVTTHSLVSPNGVPVMPSTT